jgi:zinc-ribbon domain
MKCVGNCSKCGATLVTKARFCAACGAPVAGAASIPPPAPSPHAEVADPFASTILGDAASIMAAEAAVAAARQPSQAQAAVSPMAASMMKKDPTPAPQPPAQPQPQPQVQPQLQPQSQAPAANPGWYSQPPPPPPPPPPQAYLMAGTLVLVYWADGNQYPGTVLQVSQYHVLVAFPNGGQQWIEQRYVTTGR